MTPKNEKRGAMMILADKIIRLRKKNGWSQEELAEKMNVSRQAVSKWEGAQTVPELDKILLMGELFGVTTDYLLKDEIEDEEFTNDSSESEIKRVSAEEANGYIQHRRWASLRIAFATFLCILSPIPLLLLGAATEVTTWNIPENLAVWWGLLILFCIVSVAVAVYIYCGFKNAPYEFLEKGVPFELEYGVRGIVKEQQKTFRGTYAKWNIFATCICVLSPLPLLAGAFTQRAYLTVVLLTVTMAVAGIGVMLFILAGVRWASMQKLLKEGEYTPTTKKQNRIKDTVGTVYWLILVAVYLAWSFLSNDWHITWVVFPVGGVLFAALSAVLDMIVSPK